MRRATSKKRQGGASGTAKTLATKGMESDPAQALASKGKDVVQGLKTIAGGVAGGVVGGVASATAVGREAAGGGSKAREKDLTTENPLASNRLGVPAPLAPARPGDGPAAAAAAADDDDADDADIEAQLKHLEGLGVNGKDSGEGVPPLASELGAGLLARSLELCDAPFALQARSRAAGGGLARLVAAGAATDLGTYFSQQVVGALPPLGYEIVNQLDEPSKIQREHFPLMDTRTGIEIAAPLELRPQGAGAAGGGAQQPLEPSCWVYHYTTRAAVEGIYLYARKETVSGLVITTRLNLRPLAAAAPSLSATLSAAHRVCPDNLASATAAAVGISERANALSEGQPNGQAAAAAGDGGGGDDASCLCLLVSAYEPSAFLDRKVNRAHPSTLTRLTR